MAIATITFEDISEEEYTLNINYDLNEEEVQSDDPLPPSMVASLIVRYLVKQNILNSYAEDAFADLQNPKNNI